MTSDRDSESLRPIRATLADVAASAKVSKMTASRALSKTSRAVMRPETRARVIAAAAELGYERNPLAGGLTGAATGIVAILVPDLANAVFADLISGIQEGLAADDTQTIVARTGFEPEAELEAIRRLLRWNPDAFVLTGPRRAPEAAGLLRGRGISCVEAMDLPSDPIDMAVGFHHSAAGCMAADHLIETGARSLAAITANPADSRARTRVDAFTARVAERTGQTVSRFESDDVSGIGLGRVLCRRLLEAGNYDAVFTANDLLGAGAYIECRARGVDVPGELAICGFNDLPLAAELFDGLTTIHSPRREIGRRVADLLRSPTPRAILTLDCSLVRRGST
ncbi:LacI family DNA-binding transcriptional regulator [Jannaschia formosa]|uniref:LacI family DNA-binding transcriptional regulator n=1 Tax=Jannaschia formosa TaxID=2259592 RepID=UPI000E1BA122|nr:LacI family DNA-binding transcriptional regulator [Jannaschia formosa]TFL16048.1 LacI family DNA-binding transcriptional regulator [Jannaschia formosa]